jgi:hypothetical protein
MSGRAIAWLGLVGVIVAVAFAAVAAGFGSDPENPPPHLATEIAYRSIKGGLEQQRYDLEFLILHARLQTNAGLAQELRELAATSREQAATLAATSPPPVLLSAVGRLRETIAAQTASLDAVARVAPRQGPPALRAAQERLRAESDRILDARRQLELALRAGSR